MIKNNYQEIKAEITDFKYKNDNGTSRAKLLKTSKEGDQIFLIPYPKAYNKTAVKVMSGPLNEQLGWLEDSVSEEIFDWIKKGNKYEAEISEIIKRGSEDKISKCIIKINKIKNYNISAEEQELNIENKKALKYGKISVKNKAKSSLQLLTYKMNKVTGKSKVYGCFFALIILLSIILYIFIN